MEKLRAPGVGCRVSGHDEPRRGVPASVVVRHPTPYTRHPIPSVDVAVIGAGPAGLAAAVQLARQGIGALVFERGEPGGQVNTANRVDNYLGLPGLGGREVAHIFLEHALKTGVKIVREEVRELIPAKDFTLRTSKRELHAKAVIVATGAEPRKLDGPDGGPGPQIKYDTLDIGEFRGKSTVILGGGDAALDRALRLKGVCSQLRVLSRGAITAHPGLVAGCRRAGVKMVQGVGRWTVRPQNGGFVVTTGKGTFPADVVLASIGKEPRTALLPGSIGELGLVFPSGATNIPGLYVIGDTAAGKYRQIAVAAGMGVAAAMHAAVFIGKDRGVKVEDATGWS